MAFTAGNIFRVDDWNRNIEQRDMRLTLVIVLRVSPNFAGFAGLLRTAMWHGD